VSEWRVGNWGTGYSQDSFRGFGEAPGEHTEYTWSCPKLDIICAGSPALMYLMCPATHTTKLPSGRPSTNCLRLRSYSQAGIPGVTSPCFTFYARASAAQGNKGRERQAVMEWCWVVHSPRWVWDFEVGCPNTDGFVGTTRW